MSRRRIKTSRSSDRTKGQPAPGSPAYKRAIKLRALENMRHHNNLRREIAETKAMEAAAESERVAARVVMVDAEEMADTDTDTDTDTDAGDAEAESDK